MKKKRIENPKNKKGKNLRIKKIRIGKKTEKRIKIS